MEFFQDILDQPDFCSLIFLIGVLTFLGGRMVEKIPRVRAWGVRLAVGGFLGYCMYGGLTQRPSNAGEWVGVVLQGLIAAGFVLGLAWVVLPVIVFIWKCVVAEPWAWVRRLLWEKSLHNGNRWSRVESKRNDRERAEKEAARQENEAEKTEAERRRIDARADAELAYSHYAPKIGKRFTREMFQEFLEKFMGDQHSPEDVERRRDELLATFHKHLEEEEPPGQKKSIEELAGWLQEQRAVIDGLPLDDESKAVHLAELNARYAELSTRLLEEIDP